MKKLLPLAFFLLSLLPLTACQKKEPIPALDPVQQSPVSVEPGLNLILNETYALNLLRASLPSGSPFRVEGLDFSSDSTMNISGQVDLHALGEANGMPFYTMYPTAVAFSTTGQFLYTKESGVSLTPLSLEILDFEIPLDSLPESLYIPYQNKLNRYLSELPMTLSEIYLTDDAIVLIG